MSTNFFFREEARLPLLVSLKVIYPDRISIWNSNKYVPSRSWEPLFVLWGWREENPRTHTEILGARRETKPNSAHIIQILATLEGDEHSRHCTIPALQWPLRRVAYPTWRCYFTHLSWNLHLIQACLYVWLFLSRRLSKCRLFFCPI